MEEEHFARLKLYYERHKRSYDIFLWGAKHFGYHPLNQKISEKEAQLKMQDLIGERLSLKSSMKVLDAGCGQGVVATYLVKKIGCLIDGVTIPPFEVERANNLAEKLHVSNLGHFYLMDYSDMTFDDGTYDALYTMESLVHSTNVKKTLMEFYRVLKKDCKVTLFEYSIAEDSDFSKKEMEILDRVINQTAMAGLKSFRHDRFHKLIESAGFTNVMTEDISQNVEPSLVRLRKYELIPYSVLKTFGLHKNYPNMTAAVEFYKMVKKGLIRYNIFTATK